ncbi:MAG: glutaminyl-tRNA synthetase [Harvfovirus sp.]|uniref:Glutaminyl-tRNA synthetase n=1 Tax=Harvfovirus sp. TaxID=2487768 RepID=A0A3G5A0G2_9VIRU|nr:MAG: glutaminyl-tRNA synthetase [Harvfovirus sp.]
MTTISKRTRFPPEPNGYLHLGHVKAMMFDFESDHCTVRFDDTNPETEKQSYVDAMIEDINWLEYKYHRITYTSDYFQELYDYAIFLIKLDLAYVDFTSREEIKEMCKLGKETKFRGVSSGVNLEEFGKMATGVYGENEAVLRLKTDMSHKTMTMRDPIAYRIKLAKHFRTGDRWIIYPTYAYSHCIVDSLEKITHSYCTMEFYSRRELYFWILEKLKLTAAEVIEFGRLNVEDVSLSKRKIVPLIEKGDVTGFDDPRLYTIRGLRRRGFSPLVIKEIVSHSTLKRQVSTISKKFIDHSLRLSLWKQPRVFAVMDPIMVTILNLTDAVPCSHPTHSIFLTKQVYIDKTDFREKDSEDYYRLAPPGKTIRLRFSDFITYVSHTSDNINVSLTTPANPKKIKGIIHWVNSGASAAIFEIYQDKILRYNGFIEPYALTQLDKIMQFERLGYFKFDRYSSEGVPIFLQVISLLDTYNKS